MSFSVLPAEHSNLRTLAEVFHEAFATDPEFSIMYGRCKRSDVIDFDLESYEREFVTPGRRYFKVVDNETGRVAGMAKWHYPYTLTPEQEKEGVGRDRLPESWPEGACVGLCNEFMGKIVEYRKKYLDNEKHYFMNILAVRPEYQRKGLGAMLLEVGLAAADRDGAKTYIEASKKGYHLYLRYGWREFDAIVIDTKPYGGEGPEPTKCMMRDPQPVQ